MQAGQEGCSPPLHEEAIGVVLEAGEQDAARFGVAGAGDDAIFRGAAAWAAREILARVMLNLPSTEGFGDGGQSSAERGKAGVVSNNALAPPVRDGGGGDTRDAGATGGGATAGPPAFLRELAAKLNADFWLDRNAPGPSIDLALSHYI